MRTPPLPVTYRPTVVGRVAMVVTLGAMFLFVVALLIAVVAEQPNDATGAVTFLVIQLIVIGALGVFVVRFLQARLTADDHGVTVVNYLNTTRFTWDEIDRFEVGFAHWGITLIPRAGTPLKVNAIQKANLYHWLHVRRRADRFVDELNAILRERVMPPRPDLVVR